MRDSAARRLSRLHSTLYRLTRGRIGRRLVNNDMLLLTTLGRVTGEPHTVPLLYLCDGDVPVVFASWGGRDTHPEWYLNLVADPSVTFQIDGRRLSARARTVTDGERDRWWKAAQHAYDGYTTYQSRTDREIPVVKLEMCAASVEDPEHERQHETCDVECGRSDHDTISRGRRR